ncbi:cytidine deaminase-like protein [Abortiporus biennis]|nr:cytidine deaminase-like protein [Abortiporus biennis]
MSNSQGDLHLHYLKLALDEARKCTPTPTAFCVGCVLVTYWPNGSEGVVLSTGFSRELPGNTHAEANALTKARSLSREQLKELFPAIDANHTLDDLFAVTDVYTTMEPCSIRTSGLPPCSDAIIQAHLRKCYIGVGEPDDFVNCEGASKLKNAGIAVDWVSGLEEECLKVARTGH